MEIKVNSEIVDRLALLSMEVESRKELIAYMLSNGLDTTSQQFKQYQNDYANFYAEYDILKHKVQEEYVMPKLKPGQQIQWTLDYHTGILTYED